MLGADELHDLAVDEGLGLRGAGQGRVAAQVLVGDGLHGDHVKFIAHAVAGDHGAGQSGGLFDVVGSAGGDTAELHLFGGAAAGQGGDLVLDFLLAHEVVVALLLNLHGVAQGAGGAGDDCDLLDRGAVGLHGRDERMSDLVVGDNELLLVGQDRVLFLITRDDDLNALLHIRLIGEPSAVPDGAQGRLVDDVGKFRAGGACRHSGDLVEIDVCADLDFPGVDLQDIDAALQVGELHGDAPVKAARPGQSRIQGLRTVCRRQDDDTQVLFKTVHLRQKLVQGLFALIVAADHTAVTLFADSIDLVDEDDAGSLLLGLPEQVTDLGGTHTDEHLDEFGTGHGEKRYI